MENLSMINNADQILFSCSSLGKIMSEGGAITENQLAKISELEGKKTVQGKLTDKQQQELDRLIEKRDNPELPEGVKTHLVNVYVSKAHNRREEIKGFTLEKGNMREDDSITLFSRTRKKFYKKNDEYLKNEYLVGCPDIYEGEAVVRADEIIDTKTSWSANSFFKSKFSPLPEDYFLQVQGYMALTGAKRGAVAFCLVNGTLKHILSEQNRLKWIYEDGSPEYVKKCKQIEINHIFDRNAFMNENPEFISYISTPDWNYDIPMKDRIHIFEFERDEKVIEAIYKRIDQCRKYMNETFFKP